MRDEPGVFIYIQPYCSAHLPCLTAPRKRRTEDISRAHPTLCLPPPASNTSDMASDESMSVTPNSSVYSSMHDIDVARYLLDDVSEGEPYQPNLMYDDEDDEDDDGGDHVGVRMSRLSLDTADLSDQVDDKEKEEEEEEEEEEGSEEECNDDGDDGGISALGFAGGVNYLFPPGRPTSCRRRAVSTRSAWMKECASETEAAAGGRAREKVGGGARIRPRWTRERGLDLAWEMKRCHRAGSDGHDSHSGGSSPCVVVRPRGGGSGCMWMDMEEVKACRDLGLELPCDWTVEIPRGAFTAAVAANTAAAAAASASCGGSSPTGNWRLCLSNPGDQDPGDMKARLRVWAQAVALASASRLSS